MLPGGFVLSLYISMRSAEVPKVHRLSKLLQKWHKGWFLIDEAKLLNFSKSRAAVDSSLYANVLLLSIDRIVPTHSILNHSKYKQYKIQAVLYNSQPGMMPACQQISNIQCSVRDYGPSNTQSSGDGWNMTC